MNTLEQVDLLQKEMNVLAFMLGGLVARRIVVSDFKIRQIHIQTPSGRLLYSVIFWHHLFDTDRILHLIAGHQAKKIIPTHKGNNEEPWVDRAYISAIGHMQRMVRRSPELEASLKCSLAGSSADLLRVHEEWMRNSTNPKFDICRLDLKDRKPLVIQRVQTAVWGDELNHEE